MLVQAIIRTKTHGAEQQHQSRPNVADHLFIERHESGPPATVNRGVLAGQRRRHAIKIRLCLLDAKVRLQARNHPEETVVARDLGQMGIAEVEIPRQPEPHVTGRDDEVGRHHAQHAMRFLID